MTHSADRYQNSERKQRGISLLGMIFFSALLVIVALFAMQIVPAYAEFISVKKVLRNMKQDPLATMSPKEIKDAFDKRASLEYISVVDGSDIHVERSEVGETVVAVEYQVVKPIAGNVSVLMDFSARSDE